MQPKTSETQMYSTDLAPFDYSTNTRAPAQFSSYSEPDEMLAPMPAAAPVRPETLVDPTFVPGYLYTQIGKVVRVEFLIGNTVTDRVGKLIEVGASYILLQDFSGASTTMCDLFSIKFVTIVNVTTGDAVLIP